MGGLCAECGIPVRDSFDPLKAILGRTAAKDLPGLLLGIALPLLIVTFALLCFFFTGWLPVLLTAAVTGFISGMFLVCTFAMLLPVRTPRNWIIASLFALAVAIPLLDSAIPGTLINTNILLFAAAVMFLALNLDLREIARRLGDRRVRHFTSAAVALAWVATVLGALESESAVAVLGVPKRTLAAIVPTSIELSTLVAWSSVQCLTLSSARRMVLDARRILPSAGVSS